MNAFESTHKGPILYLNGGTDLDIPLSRVEKAGGKITMPKTPLDNMFIGEFIDSEGNRIRFHSMG